MSNRTVIHSENAPKAIGPYSQGIRTGNLIFCAGQTPILPATGELIVGEIEAQTRQVLNNLKAVLEAADTDMDKVVKTTVFMTNLGDFARMNAVYAEFFPVNPPARSTVQVSALPRGAQVEIECVAIV